MSFHDAHAFAFSLATTLMAVIVIFRAATAPLSVTARQRIRRRPPAIVDEIDPFAR